MPALPDYLSDGVRLQVFANDWLRISVDVLRVHLINQGIYVGPDDHVDPHQIIAALERELAEGRYWRQEQLTRA